MRRDEENEANRDVENTLRRYRPAGPPERLRERLMATTVERRSPLPFWMAAAAALAFGLFMHGMAAQAYRKTWQPLDAARQALRQAQVDDLALKLGGTTEAQLEAEQAVAFQERIIANESRLPAEREK